MIKVCESDCEFVNVCESVRVCMSVFGCDCVLVFLTMSVYVKVCC